MFQQCLQENVSAFTNSVLHELHIFQCVDVLGGIIYIKMGTFQISQTNILSMHRMKKIYKII